MSQVAASTAIKKIRKTLHLNLTDAHSWIFNKPYSVLDNQTLI
jgi:hypothetical protein